MRRLLMLMLGILVLSAQLLAQNRTITGRVTDAQGNGVPNASVTVKGSNTGTTTNADGSFTLNVSQNARTLVISSVGFAAEEVAVANQSNVAVSLEAEDKAMTEVVVVGYGSAKRLGSTVGGITNVSGATIQDRPSPNAFDALQGKVAGLQVYTSSGEPSQLSSVRLHGVGSLGASSTPLYVVDGMPVDAGTVISLNPNDFESISVLKDASATSIYGSRAANGVIYITTKKGSPNRPAAITFQSQYGVSNLANTDYFENFMNTQELTDFWVATGYRRRTYVNDTLLKQFPFDTKWYKTYYKDNAPTYQADLSISGGGGKTSYYISGGYLDQEGLAFRSGFKRYTLRSNLNTTVTDWLKLGLNLAMANDKRQTNPYGSNSTNRGLALLAPPFYSPVDANGNEYPDMIPGWGRYHPKYLAEKVKSEDNKAYVNPTGFIQVNPIKNLILKTQAGLEAYDYRSTSVTLPSYLGSLNNGSVAEGYTRFVTRTITNTGEYKFNIAADNNFTALVGHEYIDNVTSSFNTSSTGQTDDRLILLSNGPSNRTATSSKSEYAYQSYFGRLEYNFQNRYFVDGSIRQDQASRFGKENRTANFWSVGAMWKAKQESFLRDINWLSDLTVKASVGTTGNSSIGNYESLPLVGTNTYDNSTGWGISQAGNPLLSWESQRQTTVGVNFSLLNKARFEVSYYDRVTKDMLIDVPYPFTSGFSSVITNVGSLKNSGFDVTIDGDIIKTRNAYLTPFVNFNYNKNEVTELFQGKQYWIIPNTGVSWAVGQPVSYFYPVFAQVNPQSGLPEWYLPNAEPDQIVNSRQDPKAVTSNFNTAQLQQSTGIERYAPFNGGFGLNGGYNNFSISVDFSFSKGKYLINNDRYFFENPNVFPGFNQSRTILDYWQKPGDVTQFPKTSVTNWTQFDSRLIEDASFLRMKGVTIGYSMPSNVLSRTNILKAARVYATGRNLLTFTKYTGPDPEVDSNLTLGANPNTKQVAVGLELTF